MQYSRTWVKNKDIIRLEPTLQGGKYDFMNLMGNQKRFPYGMENGKPPCSLADDFDFFSKRVVWQSRATY